MANLTDLVFVCYLSARQGPSQVTATPQPICVITNTFYHFPDNVLHPLDQSSIAFYLLSSPCFSPPTPYFCLSSILSLRLLSSSSPCFIFVIHSLRFTSLFSPKTPFSSFSVSHPLPVLITHSFSPMLFAILLISPYSNPFSSALLTSESVGF